MSLVIKVAIRNKTPIETYVCVIDTAIECSECMIPLIRSLIHIGEKENIAKKSQGNKLTVFG